MKSVLTFLLFVSFPFVCFSQNTVGGCVRDTTNKALPDANVLFYQNDSLVAGIATDKKGCFTLRLDTGKYEIHILRLGYEVYTDKIVLPQGGVNLSTVVLKGMPVGLKEVTITDTNFEAELNKSIFKIPARIKKSSVDAFQVLATVPTLVVNPFEKSVKTTWGSSIVMVNNIRRNQEYLSVIDPKNIDRVEIIRTPGSRYKDTDAIINIVTKAPVAGQSGYLSEQTNPVLKYGNYDGGYTYVAEKASVSLYGQDFFFNENKGENSFVREMRNEGTSTRTERTGDESKFTMNSAYLSANVDYIPSPNTFATFGAKYSASHQKLDRPHQKGSLFTDEQKEYDFVAANQERSNYEDYGVNAYYQRRFTKTASMDIDFNYNSTETDDNSLYRESNDVGLFYENNQKSDNRRRSINSQVNFQHRFSKVKLEEGYRFYWQDNRFENEINGIPDKMQHNDRRNYLYVNALGNLTKKLVYQLGTGWDMSEIIVDNVTTDTHNELTPSGMLRYLISGKQNVTLNYGMSRQTPSASMLNPAPRYTDSTRIVTGNPELSSFYTNKFRFGYELSANKYYIAGFLQYNLANNYITRKENLEQGVYHITYTNAARYSSATAGLNLSVDILSWWKATVNASMQYNIYKDDNRAQLNKKYWEPSCELQSMVNYQKLSVFLYYPINFRKQSLTGYYTAPIESFVNATYRLNNSWSVGTGIRYLSPLKYKTETYTDSYSEIRCDNKTDRFFRFLVSVQYNFQKGKQKSYKQKNSKEYNDDVEIGTAVY